MHLNHSYPHSFLPSTHPPAPQYILGLTVSHFLLCVTALVRTFWHPVNWRAVKLTETADISCLRSSFLKITSQVLL